MKKSLILLITLLISVFCIGAASADYATPALPMELYGTAYYESGEALPAGTVITAVVNGESFTYAVKEAGKIGGTGTFGGKFIVSPANSAGNAITFTTENAAAEQKPVYSPGISQNIALIFKKEISPTPSLIPTENPTVIPTATAEPTITPKPARPSTVTIYIHDHSDGKVYYSINGSEEQYANHNPHQVTLNPDDKLSIVIIPKNKRTIDKVTINGKNQGAVTKLDFTITEDLNIDITFKDTPEKNPDEKTGKKKDAEIPQESKDLGLESGSVLFDKNDTIGNITFSVTRNPEADKYGPIASTFTPKLIIKIDSDVQPQNSKVLVTFNIDKNLIKNPSKAAVFHNILTDVDANKWTQEKVTDFSIALSADRKTYVIKFTTGTFSYFTIAEETADSPTPQITHPSGGSEDTGSGHYTQYPREITPGFISFGTSPTVTGIELPNGSTGQVTLNTVTNYTMPEDGYYLFEILCPGYNYAVDEPGWVYFKVPMSQLTMKGLDVVDVILYSDDNEKWDGRATSYLDKNSTYATYKAAIFGDGGFCIGFKKGAAVDESKTAVVPTPQPVHESEKPVNEPTSASIRTPVPSESEAAKSALPVFGVIAGLGLIAVLAGRKQV